MAVDDRQPPAVVFQRGGAQEAAVVEVVPSQEAALVSAAAHIHDYAKRSHTPCQWSSDLHSACVISSSVGDSVSSSTML